MQIADGGLPNWRAITQHHTIAEATAAIIDQGVPRIIQQGNALKLEADQTAVRAVRGAGSRPYLDSVLQAG